MRDSVSILEWEDVLCFAMGINGDVCSTKGAYSIYIYSICGRTRCQNPSSPSIRSLCSVSCRVPQFLLLHTIYSNVSRMNNRRTDPIETFSIGVGVCDRHALQQQLFHYNAAVAGMCSQRSYLTGTLCRRWTVPTATARPISTHTDLWDFLLLAPSGPSPQS